MKRIDRRLVGVLAAGVCLPATADMLNDSSATLLSRNYYFDRDFANGTGPSEAREWAQGFILRMNSGYTQGPVGFGFDVLAMGGIKLDSSAGRSGTGLLPFDPVTGEPADEYSKLGVAAKLRYSSTDLQVGTFQPLLPVILAITTTRLFPPTFRGGYLRSQEIPGLTLHAGNVDRIILRNSTDEERMGVSSLNGRFNPSGVSDSFSFAGADYAFNDHLTGTYYYAELDNLYRQQYVALLHTMPLGEGKLKSDIRFFDSTGDGASKAGTVDNRTLSTMFTYKWRAHSIGLGYMQLNGSSAMPYIAGTDVNVNSEGAQAADFVNPKERSTQLRYDVDFTSYGVPGLGATLRYLRGRDIELANNPAASKENERDVELNYLVQSGTFKGLNVRLRQATYNNDFSRDFTETRFYLDYPLKLW